MSLSSESIREKGNPHGASSSHLPLSIRKWWQMHLLLLVWLMSWRMVVTWGGKGKTRIFTMPQCQFLVLTWCLLKLCLVMTSVQLRMASSRSPRISARSKWLAVFALQNDQIKELNTQDRRQIFSVCMNWPLAKFAAFPIKWRIKFFAENRHRHLLFIVF